MKFHRYLPRLERTPQFKQYVKSGDAIAKYREWRDFVLDNPESIHRMEENNGMVHGRTIAEAWSELAWVEAKRPYWRVYPCIVEMIANTDLRKVANSRFGITQLLNDCSVLKGKLISTSISVEFPECCAPHGLAAAFLCWHWYRECHQFDYFISAAYPSGSVRTVFGACLDTMPLAEYEFNKECQYSSTLEFLLKLVAFIGLIKDDPSFVTRDVLNEDVHKYESADEELRRRLEEKAKRRGRFGWTIGKQYECIPHLRRPHFAIRWTGKGGETPKLRPIKAAVVHRKKLTEIPTGYRDKEESVS